ncbi:MAG: cysteine desulfurase [Proteobacteria bacterium]|nr:cysteine desulfurase [Pseudomonadota bacterium]
MASASAIYLDYNATAPLRPQALAAMQAALAQPANASSVHRWGREAKRQLEAARKTIAESVSAWPQEVLFTASGTEANATALRGINGRRLLAAATEHSSVLKAVPGIETIGVDAQGILSLAELEKKLAGGPAALVSVMLANNETGVIQPIADIAALCRKHGALLHCDAVQALGKIPVDFGALGVDMLTLSAHKCGGPLGAAALVLRRDLPLAPLLLGGGQELGRRAGTENIAAIAGFAAAVQACDPAHMRELRGWLQAMEQGLLEAGGIVFASASPRLPNTSCVAMPGVTGEVQLMDFDLSGIAISAGSACSSGRIEPSHVLLAMGQGRQLAGCAIRVSGGWATTQQDVLAFSALWHKTRNRLEKRTG